MWNSRPPPFMEKSILNFHFDYLTTSLRGDPSELTSQRKYISQSTYTTPTLIAFVRISYFGNPIMKMFIKKMQCIAMKQMLAHNSSYP